MGGAIATDGSMSMQCQSCHGNMSTVGSANRVGWFMEPNCASCHTGTATSNNGQIRYASVFSDTNGTVRVPVNQTFSTQPNTPANGTSLYRFSAGHGGLQCSACHGSTHAEFPSTHQNDNVRNIAIQGHVGVMSECTACHTNTPSTRSGGPHGLHPVGQSWVEGHHSGLDKNVVTPSQCQTCHGAPDGPGDSGGRGTALSRMQADRTLTSDFGTLKLFRGAIIGCYTCHNGPNSTSRNTNAAPTVSIVSGNTDSATPLVLPVTITAITNVTLRIISQPANGSVGVSSNVLTYFPNASFTGSETFTYAAWDGSKNSTLATGIVSVVQGVVAIGITAQVPTNAPAGWPTPFNVFAAPVNTALPVGFKWNFGDGSAIDTNQFPTHVLASSGIYSWQVVATVGVVSATNTGSIAVSAPVALVVAPLQNSSLSLSWPISLADVIVEQSDTLGTAAIWIAVPYLPVTGPVYSTVTLPIAGGNRFFRIRQSW